MKDPVIINGPHVGEPLGHLEGPHGEIVTIWSRDPVDLAEAMTKAIGPVPAPPALGLGGHVEVIAPISAFSKDPPQIIYNPAGDVENQAIAQMFQTEVSAWNARAAAVQAVIQTIIQGGKVSMTAKEKAEKAVSMRLHDGEFHVQVEGPPIKRGYPNRRSVSKHADAAEAHKVAQSLREALEVLFTDDKDEEDPGPLSHGN